MENFTPEDKAQDRRWIDEEPCNHTDPADPRTNPHIYAALARHDLLGLNGGDLVDEDGRFLRIDANLDPSSSCERWAGLHRTLVDATGHSTDGWRLVEIIDVLSGGVVAP